MNVVDGCVHRGSQQDSNCDDDENDVTIKASVTDNDDGSYTVAYTPEVAGVYLMRISRNGIPISYSESRTLVHVHPGDLHGELCSNPTNSSCAIADIFCFGSRCCH